MRRTDKVSFVKGKCARGSGKEFSLFTLSLLSLFPVFPGKEKAIQPWDKIFQEKGKVFTEPHEDFPLLIPLLKERNVNRILDLGCGSGRHVVFLARHGFSVFGIDLSPSGVELTRGWLREERLSADLRIQDIMEPLPYADGFFEAVFSIQVIHHATAAVIRKVIGEIERVLKNGGFIFISVPRLRNQGTKFEEIEPHTFVPLDGPEKGLPHYYLPPKNCAGSSVNFRSRTFTWTEAIITAYPLSNKTRGPRPGRVCEKDATIILSKRATRVIRTVYRRK